MRTFLLVLFLFLTHFSFSQEHSKSFKLSELNGNFGSSLAGRGLDLGPVKLFYSEKDRHVLGYHEGEKAIKITLPEGVFIDSPSEYFLVTAISAESSLLCCEQDEPSIIRKTSYGAYELCCKNQEPVEDELYRACAVIGKIVKKTKNKKSTRALAK